MGHGSTVGRGRIARLRRRRAVSDPAQENR